MIRQFLLVALLTGFLHASFGQSRQAGPGLSGLAKLDLGVQGIGLTYESRLASKLAIDVSAGAGPGYDIAESSLYVDYTKPSLYLSVTPKYFYNREARALKGKKTLLNAGNYIGLRLKYASPTDRQSDVTRKSILINLHWGLQRAIGGRWTFGAHFGAGYAQDIDYNFGTIYPSVECRFSYVITGL